ncbi:MAG: cysteine desulfurase [Actinobacteria bacterium]|nr:MAG: cysteine desulfurase [Actinomycetota bacterium]RIK04039.1 MAG: cysteine desulfurase [Acidobacteriota bacterium]
MRPEAVEAMLPFLTEDFGNPSGSHPSARRARRAVDEAREAMAQVCGCEPGEIVFTSGGTEADNHAVFGIVERRGGSVVCSAVEHHAVLEPVEALGGRVVPVDEHGVIDLDALAAALDDSVTLVSVMLANNEVGTIQPLSEIAEIVRRRAPDAAFHSDAVQALTWLDVAGLCSPVDLLSLSAHKFGGPKGVGLLMVRSGVEPAPRLLGGGQERERRSGTHNVAGIVAMSVAAQSALRERTEVVRRVGRLRDRLADGLRLVPDAIETGVPLRDGVPDRSGKITGNCHFCFPGIEAEALLFLLEESGIHASAASACTSGAQDPSHVLAAMGVPRRAAKGSLRLSLGRETTDVDVELALEAVPAAVERLRMFR